MMRRWQLMIAATLVFASLLIGLFWLGDSAAARQSVPQAPHNTPPVAEFTVDPPSGVVGTVFIFDPRSSHDNEDSLAWLLVRFDWDGDGTYDTSWLNPGNPPPEHTYASVGTYNVTMEVKDTGGLTDTVTHPVPVADPGNNTPPTAACTVTPTVGTVDTVFTFSAAASSDGQDATSALMARWDWYDAGEWVTPWLPATQPQTFQFDRHGLKTVRLRVRDTGMLSNDTTCQVEVQPPQPNTPPTAHLVITPTQGFITTTFTIDPTDSHDNEDSLSWLSVRFDWTDDGVWDTSWLNASQVWEHTFSHWGHLTVRMEVRDTGGLTDDTTRSVDVVPYSVYLPSVAND